MFKNCLYGFGSILNRPKKIEKSLPVNIYIVPDVFEEEVIPIEPNNRNNRFPFNILSKPVPLPPVVTEITSLIHEADSSSNFDRSLECLQKATTLGSACAAARLALVYRKGQGDSNANPDYDSSVAYYLLALNYIRNISNDKWDMSLILEVIAGLSEIFRKQISRKKDSDIWNNGIGSMRHFELTLQDPSVVKRFTQKDLQKSKAIRIHISYCMALTAEFDNEISEAMALYEICRRIGPCNFTTADKLIEKCQHKIKELETKIPNVKPICVSCDYRPEELNDIWGMLVCSKCQVVAACSRECLTAHITAEHPRSEDPVNVKKD